MNSNPHVSQHLKNVLWNLEETGRTEEAIRIASKLAAIHPNELYFKLRKHLAVPIIYQTTEEINWYRNRVTRGLDEIIQEISLSTPEAINNAVDSIEINLYLACQGYNDLELQKKYGELVHRIMAAKYPQWVQPLPMPPLTQDGKIRVGYVSGFLKSGFLAKWTLGWIKYSNKQQFEIYCYHVGRKTDSVTEEFREHSNGFHHIPEDIEAVCQQIIADNLHILVFLEIGVKPQITRLAGLRLAPVQCTSMGHPLTSGSPTIDYFLSSELMEAENAEEHYSEQLIRLPNIGISFAYPTIPAVSGKRIDLNLPDNAIVYLSNQNVFKYLPQYDYIFAAIASRVPKAKIVFVRRATTNIMEQFRRRLQRAFAQVGLNSEDYCTFVPQLEWKDYCNLDKVADIFLDTFSFCGGVTTLEAIAFNLPVVTYPGEFLRGRQSYGILKRLGVTETIAKDLDEYIEIAVRLGIDREWRLSIVEKISQRHSLLYDDFTCVAALEDFYHSVVENNGRSLHLRSAHATTK